MHLALKSAMYRTPYTNKVGETLKSIASPVASYSLRALGGGDPKVVRLRRSPDDAEKDITVSEISSGSLVDWVNGKQETTLPCDVASAAAAYSLRLVNSSYTGNLVRVRRGSDDAEKDFNNANDIAAWVGSGNDGFVTTWYDQSGNENNAIQSTASNQPKIVDNGILVLDGLDFNGGCSLNFNVINAKTVACVNKLISTSGINHLMGRHNTDGGIRTGNNDGIIRGAGVTAALDSNDFNYAGGSTHSNGSQSGLIATNKNLYFGIATNGYYLSSVSTQFLSRFWRGKIQEVIIYTSDQTSNRFKIESNTNNYYNLYTTLNDGFVASWYDQSGNSNDAIQSTAGRQPKIVDAGVLVDGGIEFDGIDDVLIGTPPSSLENGAVFYGFESKSNSVAQLFQINGIEDSLKYGVSATINRNNVTGDLRASADGSGDSRNGPIFGKVNVANNEPHLLSLILDSNTEITTANIDGVLMNTGVSGSGRFSANVSERLAIGQRGNDGYTEKNAVFEVIVFESNQSSNLNAIEANINNYYKLY